MIKLSVLTVTHNNEENIDKYLRSLLRHLPKDSKIIIVDSGSSDKTTQKINKFKNILLIESKENLGFGKGSNLAAKKADGEYLLFLNPDTQVLDDSINKLVDYLENHPEVGVVAPKLVESSGKIQPSVRKLPTILGAIKEYYFGIKNSYDFYIPQGINPVEVESVVGAAMIVRREIYQQVKGFNERYFLYFEDLDFCRKTHQLGLRIVYLPEAHIKHQIGESVKSVKQSKLSFGVRTLAHFFPIRRSGATYFQVQSGNIYHGIFKAFILRLITYLAVKSKIIC